MEKIHSITPFKGGAVAKNEKGQLIKWNYDTCLAEAKKYKSVTEFHKGSKGAYKKAWQNGWLAGYTFFVNPRQIWTKETCFTEAKKYEYKKDFKDNNGSAYNAAKNNGWLNDYSWLKNKIKPKGYWTRENCLLEAKKCKMYHDFHDTVAYQKAMKNGWLDDYAFFEDYPKESTTFEVCYEEAMKFETLKDYRTKGIHYNTAVHKGYIKSFDWLTASCKPNGYWDEERCFEEAKKYNSRWEFEQNCPAAKHNAMKNGWIDNYTWFKPVINKEYKFNLLEEFVDEHKLREWLTVVDVNIIHIILRNLEKQEPQFSPIIKDINKLVDRNSSDPIKDLEDKYRGEEAEEGQNEAHTEASTEVTVENIDLDDDEAVEAVIESIDGGKKEETKEPSIEDITKANEVALHIVTEIEHMLTPEDKQYLKDKFLNDKRREWMKNRDII